MTEILMWAETHFHYLVGAGILLLEFFGTVVLIVTSVISMIKWLRRDPDVRTTISQGILMALAFKMGGEVLRTVIATERTELFAIFAIILLRGLVAALIYWEIGKEAKLKALYNGGKLPAKPGHSHHMGRKEKGEEDAEAETVAQI